MNKAPDMCLKCAYLSILDCPEGARLGCFNAERIETFQNDAEPPCGGRAFNRKDLHAAPWNICWTCRWHTEKKVTNLERLYGCLALKKVLKEGTPCPCKGGSYERDRTE